MGTRTNQGSRIDYITETPYEMNCLRIYLLNIPSIYNFSTKLYLLIMMMLYICSAENVRNSIIHVGDNEMTCCMIYPLNIYHIYKVFIEMHSGYKADTGDNEMTSGMFCPLNTFYIYSLFINSRSEYKSVTGPSGLLSCAMHTLDQTKIPDEVLYVAMAGPRRINIRDASCVFVLCGFAYVSDIVKNERVRRLRAESPALSHCDYIQVWWAPSDNFIDTLTCPGNNHVSYLSVKGGKRVRAVILRFKLLYTRGFKNESAITVIYLEPRLKNRIPCHYHYEYYGNAILCMVNVYKTTKTS